METTFTLAANFNVMPFSIFEQNADEVIMVLNFYLEKAPENKNRTTGADQERIKVTDATATGGWW